MGKSKGKSEKILLGIFPREFHSHGNLNNSDWWCIAVVLNAPAIIALFTPTPTPAAC
jgi:hypothetical protein